MDRRTSVWNLVERVTRPFSHRVFDVIGGLGVVGLGGVAIAWSGPLAGGFVLIVVIACLLAKAAFDLQRERDARRSPTFRLDALPVERFDDSLPWAPPELIGDGVSPLVSHSTMTVAVDVVNEGPHGRFTARIENVRGARRFSESGSLTDYAVDPAAWVDTIEPVHEILRGGHASLKVAACYLLEQQLGANIGPQTAAALASLAITPGEPFPLMWFWAARSATYSPDSYQMGWRLQPDEREVRFDVRVISVDVDCDDVVEPFRLMFDDAGRLLELARWPVGDPAR